MKRIERDNYAAKLLEEAHTMSTTEAGIDYKMSRRLLSRAYELSRKECKINAVEDDDSGVESK